MSVVLDDTRTAVRQIGFEQRSFWRTPQQALFIFALPVLFMVMFNSLNKGNHLHPLGGVERGAVLRAVDAGLRTDVGVFREPGHTDDGPA